MVDTILSGSALWVFRTIKAPRLYNPIFLHTPPHIAVTSLFRMRRPGAKQQAHRCRSGQEAMHPVFRGGNRKP
jgi:hypothetical protein